MRIGFIGIGLMGLPLCRRLLAAGCDLTVWNRTPEKCRQLQADGARLADTPAALAGMVDLVLLCLSDDAAVERVVFGHDGIAAGACTGLLLIDHSSLSPAATRHMASRLLAERGVHWVDAPVSGGVIGAEQGSLVIMAGGSVTAIAQAHPVLMHYAQRVTRMGDTGAGQVTKVCNQLIVAANSLLIAETVALAEHAGVDATLLAPALAGGFADSLPFQILAPRMAERRFEPVQWKVQTLLKDLGNALSLARQQGSDIPLARAAEALMRRHANAGHAGADLSSIIALHATASPESD